MKESKDFIQVDGVKISIGDIFHTCWGLTLNRTVSHVKSFLSDKSKYNGH